MTPQEVLPIEKRLRQMLAERLVCVIRATSSVRALAAARALINAGFKLIEVTMTVPGAVEAIKVLAPTVPADVMVGAGTVMSGYEARQCIDAGAQFIVSPVCETDLIRPCRDAGVVAIPAALTPTEIVQAYRLGAHVVKIFPAGSVGGPAYIRALRGPLPDIPFWVSGMLPAKEAPEYFKAGVQLVGLNFAELLPQALVEAGNWDAITAHAADIMRLAKG
ncbi:MAG TPA: bifunctional 4-hydroxy-2-oxoglutarate aldolase/2-dehydro-3-deoxy-phosphogluconate aldolase [Anaerolineae bacterium]|jgi:2-dehydro-3-deoxyphosphogluconate aldolase/(4S)-4-hydroxy-2-oxoglutarate aldolase